MKSVTLTLNGIIESYVKDLIESLNHQSFVWYYAPAEILGIDAKVGINSGKVEIVLDINGRSISKTDPLIIVNGSGNKLVSDIDSDRNKLKIGDRISIRTLKVDESKNLSFQFSYVDC